MILNTSFNLHGEQCSRPQDAITDFLDCNLDELYINGYKVEKDYEGKRTNSFTETI